VNPSRLQEITSKYSALRVALVGDICLDRYFEIDPARAETSIETGLPVHNVTRVRCQPGGAGTILNNLAALGIGKIFPATIIGQDGEGFELRQALEATPGVQLDWLVEARDRHTFTYSKPLIMHKNRPPEELSRLDMKNWSPAADRWQARVAEAVHALADQVDAMILLDQVDVPETGVVTRTVLEAVGEAAEARPDLLIIADSRRSLRGYPRVSLKMNAAELGLFFHTEALASADEAREKAAMLSQASGRHVFVTLAERGMVGAHQGQVEWVPTLPLRGEIDIVGAGDAVTANLTAALAAGAALREALELAQLAASTVIHQLGTTGTAKVSDLAELLHHSPFLEC